MKLARRRFLATSATALTAGGFLTSCFEESDEGKSTDGAKENPFQISLAQWSLHKALKAGELDNLDYPAFTKDTFGLNYC